MVLDSVTSEVGKKIKSAIKAKLTELGAYVDDELPDYIMILVGNKKTKDQMDDDLSLFLGHNTERFTSWLHEVLQRINEASGLQSAKLQDNKPVDDNVETDETPQEEKKKHKKKKDKSEKKKEKKEKKKKKDKDKSSKSKKNKESHSSPKSTKSSNEDREIDNKINTENGDASVLQKTMTLISEENETLKTTSEANDSRLTLPDESIELNDDVVNLRPDAEELALCVEEDDSNKQRKCKTKASSRKVKSLPSVQTSLSISGSDKVDPLNIKVVISNPNVEKTESHETVSTSILERLGPLPPAASAKRIINLREESSFPPKSSHSSNGIGRMVSSAISSAVKSTVVKPSDDTKPVKKLEARVRPLFSSSHKVEDEDEKGDSSSRIVSKVVAVHKRSHSSDDSNNDEPSPKKIAGVVSKVEVAPRPKRSGLQANSALILRAVADAHKSVNANSKKEVIEEKELQSTKKEIFTKSYQDRHNLRLGTSEGGKATKRFAITVPNAHLKDRIGKADEKNDDVSESDEIMVDSLEEAKALLRRQGALQSKGLQMDVDDESGNTRFVVTMDGFGNEIITTTDLRSRLGNRSSAPSSVDEEEIIEEIEEWEEIIEEEMDADDSLLRAETVPADAVKKSVAPLSKTKIDNTNLAMKKEERCRFWPACKEGTACVYAHPTKICINFPNCRFADKCLYIHPKCKFDAACTKPNCPFTHTGSRNLNLPPAPVAVGHAAYVPSKIKCRYYPKCTDMNCPFLHPKQICKFGLACQSPNCIYVHPDDHRKVPNKSLLKWTAPKVTKENTTTVASTITSTVVNSSVAENKNVISLKKPKAPLAAV